MIFAVERFPLGSHRKNLMSTAPVFSVVFVPVWVVLKVQGGGSESNDGALTKKKSDGSILGVLVILLAVVIYPSSQLVAAGVGLLGVYLLLGGKYD